MERLPFRTRKFWLTRFALQVAVGDARVFWFALHSSAYACCPAPVKQSVLDLVRVRVRVLVDPVPPAVDRVGGPSARLVQRPARGRRAGGQSSSFSEHVLSRYIPCSKLNICGGHVLLPYCLASLLYGEYYCSIRSLDTAQFPILA